MVQEQLAELSQQYQKLLQEVREAEEEEERREELKKQDEIGKLLMMSSVCVCVAPSLANKADNIIQLATR